MSDELVKIEEQEVNKVRAELAPVLAAAQALEVVDEQSFTKAMELGQDCAVRIKRIEDTFRPAREATHKAWKAVTEMITSFVEPLESAKRTCTNRAKVWKRNEEIKRQEEAAAVQREAQKRAEEERLRSAVKLEEDGKSQLADKILEKPVHAIAVQSAPVVAPKGTSVRENWQVEVTDFERLVKAVLDGKVSTAVLEPNMTVLKAMAKSLKSTANIPGVRVWDEGSVSFRTKGG